MHDSVSSVLSDLTYFIAVGWVTGICVGRKGNLKKGKQGRTGTQKKNTKKNEVNDK